MPVQVKLCVHCGERKAARPRGLCWGCYRRHRLLYPITSKFARWAREPAPFFAPPTPSPPAEPTAAEPGSAEKVAVMVARVERGEQLFHPQDARRSLR